MVSPNYDNKVSIDTLILLVHLACNLGDVFVSLALPMCFTTLLCKALRTYAHSVRKAFCAEYRMSMIIIMMPISLYIKIYYTINVRTSTLPEMSAILCTLY